MTEGEYPELVPFLDRAFGFEPERNGFLTFLPKLYRRENEPWRYTRAARDPESGALSAVLGLYPLTLWIAGRRLSCMALGNMAVDERARGQGLMTALMGDAVEQCRMAGCDLAVLGGQRQRYAAFGFEPTGADRTFRLTAANFRHCFGDTPNDVTVRPVLQNDPVLQEMADLHDRQPVRAERQSARFYDILCSWDYRPYAAFRGEALIGYFLRKGNELREPVLRDPDDLFPVLRAARTGKEDMILMLSPWETGLCLRAAAVAETADRMQWEKFAVLRFVPVLQALLSLAATECRLDDGRLTVRIEDGMHAETLTVSVREGSPTVRESCETPELTLSYPDAMAFFFSDFSPARLTCRNPVHWLFPLPLSLRMADHA